MVLETWGKTRREGISGGGRGIAPEGQNRWWLAMGEGGVRMKEVEIKEKLTCFARLIIFYLSEGDHPLFKSSRPSFTCAPPVFVQMGRRSPFL